MTEMKLRAIIVVGDGYGVSSLIEVLSKHGVCATAVVNPDEALDECRVNPPHLTIVGSDLGSMTGVRFLAELLKVSWATYTILISDEEEEAIHDRTEGLGILGAIKTVDDVDGLKRLLAKFLEIVARDQQFVSGGE
jgi:two-component SAPR family response regulator